MARAGSPRARHDPRVQLTGVAEHLLGAVGVQHELGAAAGVPRGHRGGAHRARRRLATPAAVGDQPGRGHRVGPGRRATRAPPAGALGAHRPRPPPRAGAGRAARPRARPARRRWAGAPRRVGPRRGCRDPVAAGTPDPPRTAPRRSLPRPRLRRSVVSSPGSSVVRSAGCSSDSGLSSRSVRRRGSSAAQAEGVQVGVADERVARRLDVAGMRPAPARRDAGPAGCR